MPIAYARNGDVNIAYETFGPPDGEPLLLIMGITVQMLWWPDGFCEELADRGFAVARFDNRDVGLSTHFTSSSRSIGKALFGRRGGPAYRIDDMADDAVAVMDALGWESAHLLGESLGATFAQLVAIRHPHRVRTLACMYGGGTGGPIANLRNIKIGPLLRLARKRYEDTREGGIQRMVDYCLVFRSQKHPIDEEWVRATAELCWERDHGPDGTHRQLAASRTGGNLKAHLRRLRVPTLVLHGEDDPWIRPRASRTVADTIPGARLITYPDMGHEIPRHLWATIADDVWAAAQKAASAPVPDPDRPAAP